MPSTSPPPLLRPKPSGPALAPLPNNPSTNPYVSYIPAHLVAPLPTHPDFQHDPHLPEHLDGTADVDGTAARRLRITLAPILDTVLPLPPSKPESRGQEAPAPAGGPVLHPVNFRALPLVGKSRLSHNTARYRWALPNHTDSLGLPIGQHVSLAANIGGKRVVRSYTPTSLDSELGYFDLVVKTYDNGLMSTHLDKLPIGALIDIRGPKGKFNYTPTLAPYLLLVAGGSGITPMYRIIKSAALDADDTTRMHLVFANVAEDDILLRNELEFLASKSNGRLEITYVLEHPQPGWTGAVGYVTKKMLQERLPPGGPHGGKILLCGPPGMTKAVKGALKDLGYEVPRRPSVLEDDIFVF